MIDVIFGCVYACFIDSGYNYANDGRNYKHYDGLYANDIAMFAFVDANYANNIAIFIKYDRYYEVVDGNCEMYDWICKMYDGNYTNVGAISKKTDCPCTFTDSIYKLVA